MNNIRVLDCTLRDGGYINNCNFGYENIKKIIHGLEMAKVDIIECGYIRDCEYNENNSEFNSMEIFSQKIQKNRIKSEYVLMGIYGEYDYKKLPDYNSSFADGIRVTFHRGDMKQALEDVRVIKEKGYKLYIQPTATLGYSDAELLEVINYVNQIKPYAFYIVDTFGEMREYDVMRLAQMIDNNLEKSIKLGFHSHNNLQLSYSNSVTFIDSIVDREIILDSSVFGMGRGAGNLCTELITEYLNVQYQKDYRVRPMLELIDSIIKVIREKEYWGYSPEYYLSAINKCHPSYARYFVDKNTIKFEDMELLLSSIDKEKRADFDKAYAEKIYLEFNEHSIDDTENIKLLREKLSDKEILLIGTGKTLNNYTEEILLKQKSGEVITISVNHINHEICVDYVFISNNRRIELIDDLKSNRNIICTSNIEGYDKYSFCSIDYSKWIYRSKGKISDNALLILLNMLGFIGVTKVSLAGFDGYTGDVSSNYFDENMQRVLSQRRIEAINELMQSAIEYFKRVIEIDYITPSIYQMKAN
jgi:4-hydroxy 2-oxovalerate aldolase